MIDLQKPKVDRDLSYRSWVSTLPCLLCGTPGPNHAHHTASHGMAIKGSDYSCIPLCPKHHTEIHNTGGKASFCEADVLENAIERLRHIYFTQITKGEN